MPAEKVKLRIGNVANAVLVTGQAYQDPKDALNEFISNAADEYAQNSQPGERVQVVLRRRGQNPVLAVHDSGRGMDPDRLREIARNLFRSVKAEDDRTLGEKAIGLLAFQQLGGRLDIVSRVEDSTETWRLRLYRGKATAELERERRSRARESAGTTVYISDVDPDVLRMLTQRKVVDYLRKRRGAALAAGAYELEVVEGRRSELVTAEEPDGIKVPLSSRRTLWGNVEFALYVAAPDGSPRSVAVVGRAGTTVLDDLTELDEFQTGPWDSGQVSGRIAFEGLKQSAGRRAVIRDRDAFPIFVDAVRSVEGTVTALVDRVRTEVDRQTSDRLSDEVRRIFSRVLRELSDLDNPMRSPTGTQPGEGGMLEPEGSPTGPDPRPGPSPDPAPDDDPSVDELLSDVDRDPPEPKPAVPAGEGRGGRLPTIEPDPELGTHRSRFDSESGVVFYNERHADYLMVKDDEPALLDYLATVVAKEYVVYNNPRAEPEELAEEMVRMLVRVRRQLAQRRSGRRRT